MSMNRVDDLWSRFLSEGALPPDEERELLRALEGDEALRNRLLADKQFDGLLDSLQAEEDAPQFIRSFQDRLSVEGDDSKFIAQVEEKIRHGRPKRRSPAAPPSASPWGLALVAAGVLAAIVLLVAIMSSSTEAPVVKAPEAPRAVSRPPVAPPEPPKSELPPKPAPESPKAPEPPRPPDPAPPPPNPAPAPRPVEPPAPVVPAAPERKTVTEPLKPVERAIAKVEKVDGDVLDRRGDDRRPARAGQELAAGRGIETVGAKSGAVVAYPDGTRLDLGPQTAALDFADAGKGKTLTLETGVLSADVVKQPPGQPMVLRTPHAEVRVLGTTLRIAIDPSGSTRLDVLSGKVRLTRLLDGKTVDVVTGHYAVAGAGIDLVSKSSAPKPKVVLLQENFQDPRGVDARWRAVGSGGAIKTAGQLEIDLNPKSVGANGWGGAGLISRQSFAPSMALSFDVDLQTVHASVVVAVVFIPQGQKRGDEGVFRLQLRGTRYSLAVESGEARDLAGADRAGGSPASEKWRIEVDGGAVRFVSNERELFRYKHELQVPAGYFIEIDGSARSDAPTGSRVGFDNIVVEPLK